MSFVSCLGVTRRLGVVNPLPFVTVIFGHLCYSPLNTFTQSVDIKWPGISEGKRYSGNNLARNDLSWVTPARLYDWRYRALHGSVVVGKLLVARVERDPVRRQQLRWRSNQSPRLEHLAPHTMDLKIAAQQLITAANGRLRATHQSDQYRFDMSKIICSCPSRCLTRTQADTAGKILGDYIVKSDGQTGRFTTASPSANSEEHRVVYFDPDASLAEYEFSYERYFLDNFTRAGLRTDKPGPSYRQTLRCPFLSPKSRWGKSPYTMASPTA
ncbi:uncharacterized protein B0T23DRAFT_402581 [Neurospora hispaniola]|uniref:Uncharacterized protein n=1 Tax=Neurospora hispaniola TaxID=588809 RepID=A0AAJ0MUC2_9PEZI|nr:hypothetical protein B0T23DRAFT_402581 [Neurospora hispaniola]